MELLKLCSLLDTFDACMKFHNSIGYQGRAGMEKEGAKFYSNMTRPGLQLIYVGPRKHQLKAAGWGQTRAQTGQSVYL